MNAPHHPTLHASNHLQLLKISEVAALTAMHRATIYRRIAEGAFPAAIQITKRCVRWRAIDVEHWLETRPQPDFRPHKGAPPQTLRTPS